MTFKPFADKEEIARIEKLRDKLIESLNEFDMEGTERLFIIRKINNISEKLLKAAQYSKDL